MRLDPLRNKYKRVHVFPPSGILLEEHQQVWMVLLPEEIDGT
jgi:hypothetical protein